MADRDTILAVLQSGMALAGLLLIFSGFLFSRAGSYSTKRGDVFTWLARATLLPVLLAIGLSWISVEALDGAQWASRHLFLFVGIMLAVTAAYACISALYYRETAFVHLGIANRLDRVRTVKVLRELRSGPFRKIASQGRVDQFSDAPNVICNTNLHRGCDPQRLVHAAEIEVHCVERDGCTVMLEFLAEGVRQASEAPLRHTKRKILAFNV